MHFPSKRECSNAHTFHNINQPTKHTRHNNQTNKLIVFNGINTFHRTHNTHMRYSLLPVHIRTLDSIYTCTPHHFNMMYTRRYGVQMLHQQPYTHCVLNKSASEG